MTDHSVLFQLNTRLTLHRLGVTLNRRATLADLPDDQLDRLAGLGVRWLYLLGVWQLGQAAPAISRADPDIVAAAQALLPDFTPADIAGSCFAITGYDVAQEFGGNAALAALRERLAARGLRLMLDFIPNHTAPDHPWVRATPDLYVNGTEATLAADPRNWRRIDTDHGPRIIALGRDPYFNGWTDTLQLDYANPETQTRMAEALSHVASICDGVRADMAMLVLPEIIERTWHRKAADFWPAAIAQALRANPDFTLMAEVYWGLEPALLERGFDYTYEKTFYDALIHRDVTSIRAALAAPIDHQSRMARFLENHDEPRAASLLPWPQRRAATAIAFLAPGLRFLHQNQMEGARIHASVHLARSPDEPTDETSLHFHERLLAILPHTGTFKPLTPQSAWPGNPTHENLILFLWREAPETLLVAVNDADTQSQCRVCMDMTGPYELTDQLGPEQYDRDAPDLFLDLPPWGVNAFKVGASCDARQGVTPQTPPKGSRPLQTPDLK